MSNPERPSREQNRARWSQEDPRAVPGPKWCPGCEAYLSRSAFSISRRDKDGLQWQCNDCIFRGHAKDPRRRMLSNAKLRARQKGLEFELTLEDVEMPTTCPVLGVKLVSGRGRRPGDGGADPNSPTLDRVDPTKGYVRDNVTVISWRANDLKKDASVAELEAVLAYMKAALRRTG